MTPRPESEAATPQVLATAARALGASAAEQTALLELYGSDLIVPIWLDRDVPTSEAGQTLALLRAADRHGLAPADYLVGPVAAPDGAGPAEAEGPAAYDVALSLGVLRYMRHLHLGRVDPRAVGLRIDTWAEPHDFAALLRQAVATRRVVSAVESLAPPFALYARLVEALPRYRAIAARTDPEVPPFVRAVHPGEPYAGTRARAMHLHAHGDLAPAEVPAGGAERYEGAIV